MFQARHQFEEALRLRREQLSINDLRGDTRSRAFTLGKLADTHQALGNFHEALRMRREEQLPRILASDVRERAVAMGKIADNLRMLGKLDEAISILRVDELPVHVGLGEPRSILVSRTNLALLLLSRDRPEDRAEAADLLRLALRSAQVDGIPEAARIREIQRKHKLT